MFRLILLDYSMPDPNGPEVFRQVNKMLEQQGIDLPYICCCSSNHDKSYIEEAYKVGMNNFMTKPVNAEELMNLVTATFDLC